MIRVKVDTGDHRLVRALAQDTPKKYQRDDHHGKKIHLAKMPSTPSINHAA